MEQQQKWVQLFEQVVGRKPTPSEFMAGKEAGFDLKKIKSIAGVLNESVQEAGVSNPVRNVASYSEERQEPVLAPQEQSSSSYSPSQKTVPSTKQKKAKLLGGIAVAVLLLVLSAAYYYLDQQTGADVAGEAFLEAVKKEDYSALATQLSTTDEKWKQADAEAFVQQLDEDINLQTEIEKMIKDPAYIYQDDQGNKLLGMEKTGDFLGLFSDYKVVTYPVEVFVKSNLDSLIIDQKALKKDEEMPLGKTNLLTKSYKVTGKTDLGQLDTEIVAQKNQAENNQIHLSLNSVDKKIEASFSDGLPSVSDVKLIVNEKEVAKSLTGSAKILENQTLNVQAAFEYEDSTYKTETVELTADPEVDVLELELRLSDEDMSKIEKASKAKAEKEAAAQKEKEEQKQTEAEIKSFMNDYITAMRNSIRMRQNQFARFYDTSSEAYRTMDDYVSNGGVARARVDYQETLDYTVTNIQKEGNDYAVTVHNRFREVYMSGRSDLVEKNQIFKLRPNGDSFLIYNISEY